MSINKLFLLIGLSMLFAGCSTGKYYDPHSVALSDNSAKNMGVRYLLGRGVQQDDKKAFYYFTKAANQGDALAQNELAYMYAVGKGTQRNEVKALKRYQQAAEQGLVSAQFNLGLMYLHGMGTVANKAIGMEWIKKSADHGFVPAREYMQTHG
jgi:TPR repeat protein